MNEYCVYNTGQHVHIESVWIQNYKSIPNNVIIGVPQVTMLESLLFVLHLNNLFNLLPKNRISYADVLSVLIVGESWNRTQNQINNYLETINLCIQPIIIKYLKKEYL